MNSERRTMNCQTDNLYSAHRSSFILRRLRAAADSDAAVDGFEPQLAAARADRAAQAAAAEGARDGHREVRRDVAVDRPRLDLRAQRGGEAHVDRPVDGLERKLVRPVGIAHHDAE